MYKILVPYSFDKTSKNALKHAAFIAAQKKAKVDVLHIVESGGEESFAATGERTGDPSQQIAMINLVKKLTKKLHAEVLGGITNEFLGKAEVKVAGYDYTIERVIAEHDADLVIMGTKGFHASEEMFVSSVTQKTIDECEQPVIVVKEDTPIGDYKHISYASHFEKTHTDNLHGLSGFLKDLSADLELVKVSNNGGSDADLKKQLIDVAHSLQFDEGRAHAEIIHSDDAESALKMYTQKSNTDLLTVNTHNTTGIGRFFGKNTVEHLVNEINCPMMMLNVA